MSDDDDDDEEEDEMDEEAAKELKNFIAEPGDDVRRDIVAGTSRSRSSLV